MTLAMQNTLISLRCEFETISYHNCQTCVNFPNKGLFVNLFCRNLPSFRISIEVQAKDIVSSQNKVENRIPIKAMLALWYASYSLILLRSLSRAVFMHLLTCHESGWQKLGDWRNGSWGLSERKESQHMLVCCEFKFCHDLLTFKRPLKAFNESHQAFGERSHLTYHISAMF